MRNREVVYVCAECGEEYAKWQGKCDNCSNWNTLKEFGVTKNRASKKVITDLEPIPVAQVKLTDFSRISTRISEFDRVLGASAKGAVGIVPGSVILLGGDPGIGKSTLLLEAVSNIQEAIYVSGEESQEQIKLRYDRLELKSQTAKILSETNVDAIIQALGREKPSVVVIDSNQTLYAEEFPSTPGSIVQVRECALKLQQFAKNSRTSIFLVGHVTKEGSVAGPRILEHLVDVVLYLEGERHHEHRILRAVKNRFGATDEIGIFEMKQDGLKEVKNPSKLFLSERLKNVPGSVVTATVEGTRSFLVEVQALTSTTNFGYPQRRSSGFDLNRLQLLIAVLQKRASLNLSNQDVFVNIVGGVKIKEPAVDLAVCLAIASAFKGKAIGSEECIFVEVGLSGEIREVSFHEKRNSEAERLGFKKFVKARTVSEIVKKFID